MSRQLRVRKTSICRGLYGDRKYISGIIYSSSVCCVLNEPKLLNFQFLKPKVFSSNLIKSVTANKTGRNFPSFAPSLRKKTETIKTIAAKFSISKIYIQAVELKQKHIWLWQSQTFCLLITVWRRSCVKYNHILIYKNETS